MEINKQFLKIFIVSFVLSLITQILSVAIFLVSRSMLIDSDFQLILWLNYLSLWVSFTMAPILIFVVFYFIGKNPNLMFKLKPIISALFIGNIASLFISSIISSVVVNEITVFYIGSYLGQLILTLLPTFVLSALAGLSIGHIRRKNLTMKAEPEPNPNI